MGVIMNLKILTRNHLADSKIRYPQKSILEPMGLVSRARQRAGRPGPEIFDPSFQNPGFFDPAPGARNLEPGPKPGISNSQPGNRPETRKPGPGRPDPEKPGPLSSPVRESHPTAWELIYIKSNFIISM